MCEGSLCSSEFTIISTKNRNNTNFFPSSKKNRHSILSHFDLIKYLEKKNKQKQNTSTVPLLWTPTELKNPTEQKSLSYLSSSPYRANNSETGIRKALHPAHGRAQHSLSKWLLVKSHHYLMATCRKTTYHHYVLKPQEGRISSSFFLLPKALDTQSWVSQQPQHHRLHWSYVVDLAECFL